MPATILKTTILIQLFMWTFHNLNLPKEVPNRAEFAIQKIMLGLAVPARELSFVTYDLSENHIEASADAPSRSVAAKYQLSSDVCANIASATRGSMERHAVLAYHFHSNKVFLLDAVPEEKVLACVMLDVVKAVVSQGSVTQTMTMPTRQEPDGATLIMPTPQEFAPNNGCAMVRDSRGRFVKRAPMEPIPRGEDYEDPTLYKAAPEKDSIGGAGRSLLAKFGIR